MCPRSTSRRQDAKHGPRNIVPQSLKNTLALNVFPDTPAEIDRTHLIENKQNRSLYLDTHFQGLPNCKADDPIRIGVPSGAARREGALFRAQLERRWGPARLATGDPVRVALIDPARVALTDPVRVALTDSARVASRNPNGRLPLAAPFPRALQVRIATATPFAPFPRIFPSSTSLASFLPPVTPAESCTL